MALLKKLKSKSFLDRLAMKSIFAVRRGLYAERLEERRVLASLPYGATSNDTAEYMLGRVAVTPVFLESNGQFDPSSQNWNAAHVSDVLSKIHTSLQWWEDLLATKSSVHQLDFIVDESLATTPVATKYEPIARISNDYALWVSEFLIGQGFDQSSELEANIRAFNNAQRDKLNADWSFTIFVVNSQNDADGSFPSGGSFRNAFSFAGGLFEVVPSTRPASTFSHETGHMFWARDEYTGGGNYLQRRGYYNNQNLNAVDLNPTTGFQQQPSIMSAGLPLQLAFDGHTSAPSTLAMIGWQDSDGDGIFDVLDVPLKLDGVGRLNGSTGEYQFKGTAKVQTLANLNSSGQQNDITLNKVSRIEYRINQGVWTTIAQPNQYETTLDLVVPIIPGQTGTIEIRAVDAITGIASNVYQGQLGATPDTTVKPGIQGFVWDDANGNGQWESTEATRIGWTVQLVGANHQPLTLQTTVEPDNFGIGELSSNFQAGVTVSSVGTDTDGSVGVFTDTRASTGTKVFRPYAMTQQGFAQTWTGDRQQLRVDFASSTSFVSIDAIGGGSNSFGRLEIYNASGKLLDRVTSGLLGSGLSQNLSLGRAEGDIAYAMVKGHAGSAVVLDNLRYGPTSVVVTDSRGRYLFSNLPQGTYNVMVVAPSLNDHPTSPASGQSTVSLALLETLTHIDLGFQSTASPWQHVSNPVDVDNSGFVVPLDALLVINVLNARGSGPLDGSGVTAPPFIDVTGDRSLTPLDALVVINYLNANRGGGSGEQAEQSGGVNQDGSNDNSSGGATGEAESTGTDDVPSSIGNANIPDPQTIDQIMASSVVPADPNARLMVFSVARLESCGCCYCNPSPADTDSLNVNDYAIIADLAMRSAIVVD